MKIVNTDNFGGDYPNERFVDIPSMDEKSCKGVCHIVNSYFNPPEAPDSSRFWKVVPNDYELSPEFEP